MSRPKLIEVALPLAAINREAVREKSIRHGHPSTLHLLGVDHRPPAEAEAAQRLAGGGQPLVVVEVREHRPARRNQPDAR